jgi:hypothetical protein
MREIIKIESRSAWKALIDFRLIKWAVHRLSGTTSLEDDNKYAVLGWDMNIKLNRCTDIH